MVTPRRVVGPWLFNAPDHRATQEGHTIGLRANEHRALGKCTMPLCKTLIFLVRNEVTLTSRESLD